MGKKVWPKDIEAECKAGITGSRTSKLAGDISGECFDASFQVTNAWLSSTSKKDIKRVLQNAAMLLNHVSVVIMQKQVKSMRDEVVQMDKRPPTPPSPPPARVIREGVAIIQE